MEFEPQAVTSSGFDLWIVKDFFKAETCRALIDKMRCAPARATLTYGRGEGSVDETIRRARQVMTSKESLLYVTRCLQEHTQKLEQRFGIELGGIEEPQFLRYGVGDYFVAHQDGNTGLINLESDRKRRVSVTVFLNTQSAEGDGYSGGLLVFSDWRTNARREIGGESGMLVAFRSETTHEVTPVTHGERFAIVSWYGRRASERDD